MGPVVISRLSTTTAQPFRQTRMSAHLRHDTAEYFRLAINFTRPWWLVKAGRTVDLDIGDIALVKSTSTCSMAQAE